MFILFMSAGVLETASCMAELKAALDVKKPVVLVTDCRFRLPTAFPKVRVEEAEAIFMVHYERSLDGPMSSFVGNNNISMGLAAQHRRASSCLLPYQGGPFATWSHTTFLHGIL